MQLDIDAALRRLPLWALLFWPVLSDAEKQQLFASAVIECGDSDAK